MTDEALSLERRMRRCRKCPLKDHRTRVVPGEGPVDAEVMLVGEAPGKNEDEAGLPFVGQAGDYLDGLLEAIGLDRDQVFVTSAIKCRPPRNRPPHVGEIEACRSWLEAQIELVDPSIVVLMGSAAARQMLDERGKMTDLHGQVRERDGRTYLLTYHPAAGMRFPDLDVQFRADFAVLKRLLARAAATPGGSGRRR
jgi:DNA polymerase